MGYVRFFRRVRLAPGVTLNLSKSGPSLSLGIRGAHVTVGRTGFRRTVGLPGTGIFYTSRQGWHRGIHTAPTFRDAASPLSGWRRIAYDTFLVLLALFTCGVLLTILLYLAGG